LTFRTTKYYWWFFIFHKHIKFIIVNFVVMASDNEIIAKLTVEGAAQFKSTFQDVEKQTDSITASINKMEVAISEATDPKEIKRLTNELEAVKIAAKASETAFDSAKAQLKSYKAETLGLATIMAQLKSEGKQNTQVFKDIQKQFEETKKKAGQLSDKIGDVSSVIRNLSSDTRGIDNVVRGVAVLANGMQLAAGVSALLGDKNSSLQEGLIKLNGVMAITNSVQQIANEFTKEDSIFKVAAAKATALYTLVVGESAGALKLFRLALAATGIGLIVLAITELYLNWDKLSSAIFGSTKNLEDFNKQQKIQQEQSKQRIDDLKEELRYQVAIGNITKESAAKTLTKGRSDELEKQRLALKEQVDLLQKIKKDFNTIKTTEVASGSQFGTTTTSTGRGATLQQLTTQGQITLSALKAYKTAVADFAESQDVKVAAKKIIKTVKDEIEVVPIRLKFDLDLENNKANIFEQLQLLINEAEKNLINEFTINPNSDSLVPLSARLRDLNRELEILKARLENIKNPSALTSGDNAAEILKGMVDMPKDISNEKDPIKPLTFWERLFGTKADNQTQEQEQQSRIQKAQYIVSQINDIASGIGDVASKAIAISTSTELNALEERRRKGIISEKEFQKESARIKNEANEKQRAVDIALAVAKVPLVVLQALSSAPPPANFVLAALGGALALAQVAILAAAPLPKFKDGGSVEKRFKGFGFVSGKSHAQGGVNAELEGSEYVIKGDAVSKYGTKFFDEVNSLKFNPILSMPKKALIYHKKDTKALENMAIIASYLKQGNKTDAKGNILLSEISNKLSQKKEYV
jgi:hypothetical protein